MAHVHHVVGGGTGRRLAWAMIATAVFVAGETIAGVWSHSLALVSDAGHNFADALALGLSWFSVWIARRPATPAKTYGFHRVGVLAALINASSLVVIAGVISWEAVEHLRRPEAVQSGPMIWVALVAIVLNAVIARSLHGGSKDDLNVRSAYLHMLGDAVAAAGVVIGGIIIATTGQVRADPIVSLLIAALILWSSWGILVEAVNVLLEATPVGIDVAELERAITSLPEVRGVHHLHVWTVASGIVACSCHVVVSDQLLSAGQRVYRSISDRLLERFKITHVTVQLEDGACSTAETCHLEPHDSGHDEDQVTDHVAHEHRHERGGSHVGAHDHGHRH